MNIRDLPYHFFTFSSSTVIGLHNFVQLNFQYFNIQMKVSFTIFYWKIGKIQDLEKITQTRN